MRCRLSTASSCARSNTADAPCAHSLPAYRSRPFFLRWRSIVGCMGSPPRDARVHAATLLGLCMRLAQGHLPLGTGCSCGALAVNISVADLERDLLDYLHSKHPQAPKAASLPELLR